jgi:hypothetical protein
MFFEEYIKFANFQYWPDSRLGQSHFSPLRALRRGGGDPLCVLASRRWGPIYIASYTHTLGSWDGFYRSLRAVNVKGTSVTTWADERSLRRCLMQLSDTCFGTTASSSSYSEKRP